MGAEWSDTKDTSRTDGETMGLVYAFYNLGHSLRE